MERERGYSVLTTKRMENFGLEKDQKLVETEDSLRGKRT